MAYGVSRRVREIGVRIALGAGQAQVVRLVLGRSMRLAGLGLLIGLVGAVAVGQALRSQLLGVSPRDPLTFAGVGLLLAAVALAASASGGSRRLCSSVSHWKCSSNSATSTDNAMARFLGV